MNKFYVACLGLTISSLYTAQGGVVSINGSNGVGGGFTVTLNDSVTSNPLAVGSVIEVGYFLGLTAVPATPEDWNTFTAIPAFSWNIGMDTAGGNTNGPGNFAADFTQINDGGVDVPTGTLYYGLRFYNGASVPTSTRFNTAASEGWNTSGVDGAPTPGSGQLSLNAITGFLQAPGFAWEDGTSPSASSVSTTLAIPEPSSLLLSALGFGLLAGRRKRA